MVNFQRKQRYRWEDLLTIMHLLRAPEGCPWDREQTHQSIRRNFLEETYEALDAIDRNDTPGMCEELGDVLLQVVFHSVMEEEQGRFTADDVVDGVAQKLVFRHPHVFGTTHVDGSNEVEQNWEELKLKEKGGNKTVLEGVPSALPALIKAYRIQDKARNVGFDWEEKSQVWDKVFEEFGELKNEIENMNPDNMENEFGDLFFSLINAARLYDINPENALEHTNQKFIRRFNYLEQETLQKGKNLKDMSLAEMDAIWDEAKQKGL